LAGLLQQKRHLADLGLAVSKINHDLRNILASAQLFTDRLAAIPDTTVQRLAPKLVSSLDRALGYSQAVLAYGKAREAPPARRLVLARRLVEDVAEVLGLTQVPTLTFDNRVPADLELDADADQMFRVALNLMRNAVQALEATDDATLVRRLTVTGERRGTVVALLFSDTGPGVPPRAKEGLFKAFQGSTRPGGTGLGLAIAAELVRAHGGEIELLDQAPGATFRVQIPDRPVDLETARRSGKRGER
jgi:signal transduction histidine kinase